MKHRARSIRVLSLLLSYKVFATMRLFLKPREHMRDLSRRLEASLGRTKTGNSLAPARLQHLDGIRAVALIGVFLFHFKVPHMHGGFLGVDIFFVLSGFLMTRALLLKVEANIFSVPEFLAARVRRICPSLLVTILATLVTGSYVLPVTQVPRLSESSSSAALFGSNLKFLAENGYHDAASSTKPLLHTWSLSVEGQFYAFWSVLGLLGSIQAVVLGMLVSIIASLASNLIAQSHTASLFFCAWSRLYEFGVGAAAVLIYDSASPTMSSFLGCLGAVAIGVSFLFARPDHNPIILVSLPAVSGTALLIATPQGIFSKWLGRNQVLSLIGKLSYSAYLVHWPSIVYCISSFDDETNGLVVAFVITMILTPALFYGIENAFRVSGKDGRRALQSLLFSFALLCITLSCASLSKTWSQGVMKQVEDPIPRQGQMNKTMPVSFSTNTLSLRSQKFYGTQLRDMQSELMNNMSVLLWHSRPATKPYAMIVGDSYASHMIGRMHRVGKTLENQKTKQFYFMSSTGCLPTIIPEEAVSNYGSSGNRPLMDKKCAENSGRALKALKSKRARTLVLVSRWQDYMFEKSMYVDPHGELPFFPLNDPMRRISNSLKLAVKLADKVKIIGLSPSPQKDTMSCLWKNIEGGKLSTRAKEACPQQFQIRDIDVKWNADFKEYLRKNHPKVQYLEVIGNKKLCTRTTCDAWDSERGPMRIDLRGHMTYEGSMAATPVDVFD